MQVLNVKEICGGVVRRRFDMGGKTVVPGTNLTAAQLKAMPTANRNALINTGAIEVWPHQAGLEARAAAAEASETREQPIGDPADLVTYIMPVPGGYDVVQGRKLNSEPLKKADAVKLAKMQPAEGPTSTH